MVKNVENCVNVNCERPLWIDIRQDKAENQIYKVEQDIDQDNLSEKRVRISNYPKQVGILFTYFNLTVQCNGEK